MTKPKVMIVDDEVSSRQGLSELLSTWGYETSQAVDGLEAFHSIQQIKPDVVLTDVIMPRLDGFGAIRRLKLAGSRIKVVFLTVWEDTDFVREAIALGVDAYVVKSRMATDLIPAINEALAERRFISPTLRL